jgi:predicted NACHT family NTPase
MAINPINILVEKLASILTDIAKTKLERSEEVVSFLRRHGYENLDDDFEVLYVHTMVRRRQAEVPTAVLEIFRIPEVVEAFRKTWQAGEMLPFEDKIKWAIEAFASGDDVKGLDVDILKEGRKFYDTFTLLVSQARTPLQQENSRLLKDIHEATVNKLSLEDEKSLLDEYLADVVVATSRIDIQGIYSMSGAGRKLIYFPIEQHYTPLKTMSAQAAAERSIADASDGRTSAERIPLTHLLSTHNRLLIIGEPGGGKTTFLRFIACVLAKDILGQGEPGRKLHLGFSEERLPLIPIWIRLSAVAGALKKGRTDIGETGVWRVLSETMAELFGRAQAALLQKFLDDGRCALLLDGLDEEPNPNVRKQMVAVTDAVLHHWGKNLIVLSSRPFGYQAVSALENMATAHIDAFGEDEILEFLNRWATALFPDEEERSHKAYLPELKAAVLNIPRIRRMAKNPVMLTCLCVVHWNEKKLPEGKADLLEAVLRWLLNAKEEKREARGYHNTFAEECFKSLALAMTKHANGKQSQADLAWAAEQLENPFLDEMGVSGARLRRKGMDFLEAEMLDSGVVEQAGPGELRFWHLTFQEHYAAKALVELSDSDGPEGWWHAIAPHLDDRQWDEVFEHFAGCLAMTGRRRLNLLVERILGTAKPRDLTSLARAVGVLGRIYVFWESTITSRLNASVGKKHGSKSWIFLPPKAPPGSL